MSDSPPPEKMDTFSKMDALLKKHRGGEDAPEFSSGHADARIERAAPPDAWLPVLTQVIERGAPPPSAPTLSASPSADSATHSTMDTPIVSDTLAEQLMSELAPRLSEVMEKQVAAELRRNLDQTVATLLAQLDVNVREIVRDAVAEKLKQARDPTA